MVKKSKKKIESSDSQWGFVVGIIILVLLITFIFVFSDIFDSFQNFLIFGKDSNLRGELRQYAGSSTSSTSYSSDSTSYSSDSTSYSSDISSYSPPTSYYSSIPDPDDFSVSSYYPTCCKCFYRVSNDYSGVCAKEDCTIWLNSIDCDIEEMWPLSTNQELNDPMNSEYTCPSEYFSEYQFKGHSSSGFFGDVFKFCTETSQCRSTVASVGGCQTCADYKDCKLAFDNYNGPNPVSITGNLWRCINDPIWNPRNTPISFSKEGNCTKVTLPKCSDIDKFSVCNMGEVTAPCVNDANKTEYRMCCCDPSRTYRDATKINYEDFDGGLGPFGKVFKAADANSKCTKECFQYSNYIFVSDQYSCKRPYLDKCSATSNKTYLHYFCFNGTEGNSKFVNCPSGTICQDDSINGSRCVRV